MAAKKSAKKTTKRSTKRSTKRTAETGESSSVFTAEERAAMREHVRELKAARA